MHVMSFFLLISTGVCYLLEGLKQHISSTGVEHCVYLYSLVIYIYFFGVLFEALQHCLRPLGGRIAGGVTDVICQTEG